jgi:MoaA/NifB/PqqE/SkfB family radical SAM enzyme
MENPRRGSRAVAIECLGGYLPRRVFAGEADAMPRCSAPWYELNISAPDNIVSACCYYSGAKDAWQDQPVDIAGYWNSPAMQTIRRINNGSPPEEPNGCSNCFYFVNRKEGAQYFDLAAAREWVHLSPKQADNLRRACEDFENGREEATCTPLRIYANFGFACNLDCTMCHQVPRRRSNRRQVTAESLLAWPDTLAAALEVTVIGGEPFALPEAIKFIRAFIADPAYDEVRLVICTNGTVHHKHMDVLRRKRKLSMAISLDSIGEGFERIRVNGKWPVVERNILEFLELQRTTHPEWSLQTNALIQKNAIPLLPRFAEFHANHNLATSFYDFISFRGTEDTFDDENVLHNPHLLDDMPDWEDYFTEAIETFKRAGIDVAANTLDHYRNRLAAAVGEHRARAAEEVQLWAINRWEPILACRDAEQIAAAFAYSPAPEAGLPLFARQDAEIMFSRARDGDHAATEFLPLQVGAEGGVLRLRLSWSELQGRRRAHVWVQGEDLAELQTERRLSTSRAGAKELVLTVRLGPGPHRVRLVAMPTGEDASLLPGLVEVDLAGSAEEVAEEMLDAADMIVAAPSEPAPGPSAVAPASVAGWGLRRLYRTWRERARGSPPA